MCCKGKNSESDKYCVFVGTIHNVEMFFCGIEMQRTFCLLFHSPARRCVNHLQKSVDIQNELEDDDMEETKVATID